MLTCFAYGATAVPLGAQPRLATEPTPAVADASAKQRAAIAAMQESIARQQGSIQQQSGRAQPTGFFVLPAPAAIERPDTVFAPAECDPLPSSKIDTLVAQAAQREGLDEALLRAVMKQESGFRPCAVSAKGAMGLMQLMPATADHFGARDPFDPEHNVSAGARFLKQLLARYDSNLELALAAYNAGPGKVDAANRVPQIPETLGYVQQILSVLPAQQ